MSCKNFFVWESVCVYVCGTIEATLNHPAVSCSWPRKALVAKKEPFFFCLKQTIDRHNMPAWRCALPFLLCLWIGQSVCTQGILKSLLLNRPSKRPSFYNFSLGAFKVRWVWISVLKHWGAASIEMEISLSQPCTVFLWTTPGVHPPVHPQKDKKAEKEKRKKGNIVNDERGASGEQRGWWNGSEGCGECSPQCGAVLVLADW